MNLKDKTTSDLVKLGKQIHVELELRKLVPNVKVYTVSIQKNEFDDFNRRVSFGTVQVEYFKILSEAMAYLQELIIPEVFDQRCGDVTLGTDMISKADYDMRPNRWTWPIKKALKQTSND